MSERIEKLSQLAWTKTSKAVPFYDSTGNISREFNLKYQQEFAELIVGECADVCERFGESGDGYTCSAEILEHFGVEE